MSWWVDQVLEYRGAAYLLSWVFWVIGSVVLHELAHGWMAIRCGDRTPIETGHMTLNPIVHMGGTSLIAFALIGIAWGQMPVDPSRFRRAADDAKVAFAGPATNLALATFAIVTGSLWAAFAGGVPEPARSNLFDFFIVGAELNLVLLAFNLLPLPPLDGSSILARYLPPYRRVIENPSFRPLMMILFLVLFIRGGPLIFGAARRITTEAMTLLLRALPG